MEAVHSTVRLPKRWVSVLAFVMALALLVLTGCAGSGAQNSTSTDKGTPGLVFSSTHGGYEVMGYDGPEVDVVIPDEYEGYPVVAIADKAFKQAQIDSVTLGKNITRIGDGAFMRCEYLETVNLNAALEEIDYEAFERCSNLRTVSIPADSALEKIDTCAFFQCRSLESFTVPASTTYLGTSCFKGCTGLTQFAFASGWNGNIDGSCFEGCTSLGSIDIPSLVSLGKGAFSGWTSAQSVHIGSNLDSVKVCYSGYVYEVSQFESMSGMSVDDFWFEGCKAPVTSG